MAQVIAGKRQSGAGGSRSTVEPKAEDEDLTDSRRVAVKIVPVPPKLDFQMSSGASGGSSSGASGGPDGRVPAVSVEDVTHQLRQAGIPLGFSVLEKDQVAAARSSTGVEEGDDSRIKEQLGKEDVDAKTHQAALGGGESVHLNLNDSSLSEQSVDLLTVNRMHVSDGVAGGSVALNVHCKGLNSIE